MAGGSKDKWARIIPPLNGCHFHHIVGLAFMQLPKYYKHLKVFVTEEKLVILGVFGITWKNLIYFELLETVK